MDLSQRKNKCIIFLISPPREVMLKVILNGQKPHTEGDIYAFVMCHQDITQVYKQNFKPFS